jgi:two-component sensor histidine kinase
MRVHLMVLILIVLIPQLGLGGLIAFKYANDARNSVEESTRRLAANFSDNLERFLEGALASIQTLAKAADPQDLKALDILARQLVPLRGTAISMRDKSGQQLLNTVVPFGTPLPRTASDAVHEADARALETGRPVFSNLYQGTVANKWFFLIDVPVDKEYILNIAVSADDLRQIMFKGLPDGWAAAVIDGNGRVMARATDHERFVGQSVSADLARSIQAERSKSLQNRTLDGLDVYASFIRSPISDYTVIVSAPRSLLDRPVHELWLWLTALTMLAAASSLLAAWWWSKRIVASLTQLENSALAAGDGLSLDHRTPIREFNAVSQSINKAATEIRAKNRKQDHLIAELNHRVKNTLAVLQAITIGTVQSRSKREVADALRFRIHGLSSAHDLLNANDWDDVDIGKILRAVSAMTAHVFDDISGPRITLQPKAVVALCQVFTELCEGAIFCNVRSSRVAWVSENDEIAIRWDGICDPDTLQAADPFSLHIIHLCIDRQLAGRFEFRKNQDDWEWVCFIPLHSHLGDIGKIV